MHQLKMVKVGKVCEDSVRLTETRMVFDACRDMAKLDREHFVVLHLDGKNRIIARETVSIGSLNQTIVHPREVFKAAVHNGSAAIICVHNHPTGDPTPSNDDIAITRRLREAGEIIGIKILDHIVIGQGNYLSFIEAGYMSGNHVCTASPTHAPAHKRELSAEEKHRNAAGALLRLIRKQEKITQGELSKATGLHQSHISLMETGHRGISEDELQRITVALKIGRSSALSPPEAQAA